MQNGSTWNYNIVWDLLHWISLASFTMIEVILLSRQPSCQLGLFTSLSTAHAWKPQSLSRDEFLCVFKLWNRRSVAGKWHAFEATVWQEMDLRHVKWGEFSSRLSYWHIDISMLSLDALPQQSTKVRLFHTLLDFKAIVRGQLRCARSACSVSLLWILPGTAHPWQSASPLKSPYLYWLSHTSLPQSLLLQLPTLCCSL